MAKKKKPAVPEKVREAVRGDLSEPQLAEFVAAFTHCAGGVRGLAKMMWETYTHPQATASVKHRIVESVLRGMKHVNDRQGSKLELGLTSEEDLQREAEQIILRMGDGVPGTAAEGVAGPPQAGAAESPAAS